MPRLQLLREFIAKDSPRYLIVNTGNANAATGKTVNSAKTTCVALAEKPGRSRASIALLYRGDWETLPADKIIAGLDSALANLSEDNWLGAAHGIMTTDTTPKDIANKSRLMVTYTVTGISKGAGMIRPNMATIRGFVATDANIEKSLLQNILTDTVNQSFNRITVDGDTSTNDCCALIATGQVGEVIDSENHLHYQAIYQAINNVMIRIAQLIVRDGGRGKPNL